MDTMSGVHRLDAQARDRLIAHLEAALSCRTDVVFGLIFGSFVDRDAFRDVDLGIWTTESAGPCVDVDLAAVLSGELDLPIDVRRLNDASVPFLFHALRGRAIAVRDERRLADLMERTARDYHDRAPLLRLATREAFAR
jgi:predicted nucleotidyltransferase